MTAKHLHPSVSLSSAKRTAREANAGHYDYYAGYSTAFVSDILEHFDLPQGNRVLDPWNGSGTTTKVAGARGLSAVGYDINPAMTIIAKAGSVGASTIASSIDALLDAMLDELPSLPFTWSRSRLRDDALYWWFSPTTVACWRRLEWALQRQLIRRDQLHTYQPIGESSSFDDVSPLAAFFYVAAFQAVRSHLIHSRFATSNPTWMKVARKGAWRLRLNEEEVTRSFRESVCSLKQRLLSSNNADHPDVKIETINSTLLPLPTESVNAVVASPPYCTRIDYAVTTRPELAFLGLTRKTFDDLRRQMMGTTTIPEERPTIIGEWGTTCVRTLAKVESHHTVASDTYYIKNITQYFDALYRSVVEIDRVLVPGGKCGLVVQDSYYKDVHIDLACIVEEMARSLRWRVTGRSSYEVTNSFAAINNRAKPYRQTSHAVECAVILQK